jgi:hypothetical protein
MHSLDRWWLCSGRNCDSRTLLPSEEQKRVLDWLFGSHFDAVKLHSFRSLMSRERLGAEPKGLSDNALLREVERLIRIRSLHVHLDAQKTHHRSGSYATPEDAVPIKSAKRAAREIGQVDWDTWVAIKLVDEEKKPISGARFRITLPDKSIREGRLDAEGRARVDSSKSGQCKICFPDLDSRDWHPL